LWSLWGCVVSEEWGAMEIALLPPGWQVRRMRILPLVWVACLGVLGACDKRHRLNQWANHQELNRFQADALAQLVHGGPAIDLWPR
jgi:hypothetical protein